MTPRALRARARAVRADPPVRPRQFVHLRVPNRPHHRIHPLRPRHLRLRPHFRAAARFFSRLRVERKQRRCRGSCRCRCRSRRRRTRGHVLLLRRRAVQQAAPLTHHLPTPTGEDVGASRESHLAPRPRANVTKPRHWRARLSMQLCSRFITTATITTASATANLLRLTAPLRLRSRFLCLTIRALLLPRRLVAYRHTDALSLRGGDSGGGGSGDSGGGGDGGGDGAGCEVGGGSWCCVCLEF
mmetsp:Transcript_14428/g.31057  ORF Transcript_14428/g.31057 Transcript_14428/m.31057 type:complete len:243 (+) Transcript_14428:366-1094(+)